MALSGTTKWAVQKAMGTNVFQHPWLGGLFGDDELAVLLGPDRQLAHMLCFEAEYLRALGRAGTVDKQTAEAAASAVSKVSLDMAALSEATRRDGVVVPELVRQLRAAVDPDFGSMIHSGLTSQDVIDTALILALKEVGVLLDLRLGTLEAALTALKQDHGARPLLASTRMQAALPISVADRIATWQQPLANHRQRLEEISPRVLQLQFGGAVGTRAASGAAAGDIAVALSEALGLQNPDKAWHAMRDPLAEYAGWLSLVSGTLGKMGQDVALMAQQGVDAISLASGGGSSAMPHKQNPVSAETLVALARFNATLLSGMHQALVHEQERSGAAWTLEWLLLPQMILATGRSLQIATELVGSVVEMGSDTLAGPHRPHA